MRHSILSAALAAMAWLNPCHAQTPQDLAAIRAATPAQIDQFMRSVAQAANRSMPMQFTDVGVIVSADYSARTRTLTYHSKLTQSLKPWEYYQRLHDSQYDFCLGKLNRALIGRGVIYRYVVDHPDGTRDQYQFDASSCQ